MVVYSVMWYEIHIPLLICGFVALLLAIIAGGGYYVYSSLEEKDSETDANRMASVENKEEFSQLN